MRMGRGDWTVEREVERVLEDLQSCSGWESDPQSFSKRASEHFCLDVYNEVVPLPQTIKCSGQICILSYIGGARNPPWHTFDIKVDLSRVPGIVSVSGSPFWILREKLCSYRYTCSTSGTIGFTRVGAPRFISP